jgi:transcriptional regulator with XRE-family HTH domain
MYGPPGLMPSDLAELVCRVGGAKQAARLLGITRETVVDWERNQGAPPMALRLLWYAGPDGRAEALRDMENELQAVAAARDAAAADYQRHRHLVDERRAALGARVKSLEHENEELRRLLDASELASGLDAIRSITERLVRTLSGRAADTRAPSTPAA